MHIPAIHALLGLEFPLVGVDEDLARRAKVLARVVRAHLAARLGAGRRRQARVRYRYAAWATSVQYRSDIGHNDTLQLPCSSRPK